MYESGRRLRAVAGGIEAVGVQRAFTEAIQARQAHDTIDQLRLILYFSCAGLHMVREWC